MYFVAGWFKMPIIDRCPMFSIKDAKTMLSKDLQLGISPLLFSIYDVRF